MSAFIDLTGQVFGRLTVLEVSPNKNSSGRTCWQCLCTCGGTTTVTANSLRSGNTKSCGCYHYEVVKQLFVTHGMSKTLEYKAWQEMKKRCFNTESKSYMFYGGRGISVCRLWVDSFEEFYAHIGKSPSLKHTLERIENNLGYYPGNVRWATRTEQANNTRRNFLLTLNGVTRTLAQWGHESDIPASVIQKRIKAGWGVSDALTRPVRSHKLPLASSPKL